MNCESLPSYETEPPTPYQLLKYLGTLDLMAVCFVLLGLVSVDITSTDTLIYAVVIHTVYLIYTKIPLKVVVIVLLSVVSHRVATFSGQTMTIVTNWLTLISTAPNTYGNVLAIVSEWVAPLVR
jgi:hypothetical protein